MIAQAVAQDRPPLHTYEPREERSFWLGGIHLTTALYGSRHGDWSSRQFTLPPDESKECLDRYGVVFEERGVHTVRALVMQFNARMVGRTQFRQDGVRAGRHNLYRNTKYPGEGLLLRASETALLTPSNCANGVLTFKDRCAVIHFGRWSLFDKLLVEHGRRDPEREHESILYAALQWLGVRTEEDARRVEAVLFWGTHLDDFRHPVVDSPHAGINLSLRNYLRSDLGLEPRIVDEKYYGLDLLRAGRLQLNKKGVPPKNIVSDFSYLPKTGVWRDGGTGKERNAVLVTRHN